MMAPKSLQTGLLLLAQLKLAWGMALLPRGVTCDYETPASSGDTCTTFAAEWGLTEETFASLNPTADCPTLVAGQSYCVVGTVSVAVSTTSSSSTTTSSSTTSSTFTTSTVKTTTTTAGNGITTPTPVQSGITDSCSKFDLVESGDTCASIASTYNVPLSSFYAWNPAVGSSCAALGLGDYVCVDIIGYTAVTSTSSTSSTTTTTASNGIITPTPVQSGMIDSCSKFDLVQSGDTCASIATTYNIELSDFYTWNPAVGSSCANLDLGYYVCVDAVPTPTQAGISESCSKFDLVESGDTCAAIASAYSISLSDFYAWNPAVGSTCSDLDLGYYVCVGTDSSTVATTTTSAGNGITTPTPDEPGMVSDCTKFWLVGSGDTCADIASSEGITVADIEKWNSQVGSGCTDIWLGDYICVGV
ncbi:Peptidoglycan-binding Lysin subgroup [Penicillium malachiteum]|uniref:Peptidoglycan-binding Lysin subgroup n=1 Tax=Penicillium malachiteum TaxID=1324776 RepID=A0AAD6HM61_9EURO|nr:Peptidoglycan-binding Lysin subgroup [Penicillium malachiteum]